MLIEVIPFGGSIDDRWLTYFVQDDLAKQIRIGSLVEVPFRNALDYAIVTKLESSETPENLLSISRVVCAIPLLAPYQITVIFALASYYFVHAHQILSLFLSKWLLNFLEKNSFIDLRERKTVKESFFAKISFIHHTKTSSLSPIIAEYIEARKKWVAIIFPDDFAIEGYIQDFPIDKNTTLIIQNSLSETRKYKCFRDVYNEEKTIIIWTRKLLYYNLSGFPHILYIEDALHTEAMRFQHTYKHIEVLNRIVSSGIFDITILSTLPSIESMYRLHEGKYKLMSDH